MRTVLRAIQSASLICILAGCTSGLPEVPEPIVKPARFTVTQTRQQDAGKTAFTLCEIEECPQRSVKRFPPAPPPKPASQIKALEHAAFKVHFPTASDKFDAAAQEEIIAIARSGLLTRAEAIVLTGRSNSAGNRAANQKLAIRRAQAVKAVLLRAGVPDAVIRMNDAGCCEEAGHPTAEGRRVDINITARSK
jgi:outer membrane protein OmpA-like peptidoglycan-associated protein